MNTYLCKFVVGFDPELGGEQLRLLAISKDGEVTILDSDNSIVMPSAFVWDKEKNLLYITDEQNNGHGRVLVFSVISDKLFFLQAIPTFGSNPCHVVIDKKRCMIYVSHYSGGGIARYKLLDTGLVDVFSADVYMRTGEFHFVLPLNEGFIALDCGNNGVVFCAYDLQNRIIDMKFSQVSSPRQIVMDAENHFFGVSEMESQIFDLQLNNMKIGKKVSSRIFDTTKVNTASTLRISKDKDKVIVSNRGDNSIVVYDIYEGCLVNGRVVISDGNDCPRDFNISNDDKFIIVSYLKSDYVYVYKLDDKWISCTFMGKIEMKAPLGVQIL